MKTAAIFSAALSAALLLGGTAGADGGYAYPDYWHGGPPLPPLYEHARGGHVPVTAPVGHPRSAPPATRVVVVAPHRKVVVVQDDRPWVPVPTPRRSAETYVDPLIPNFGSMGVVTTRPHKDAVWQDPWYSPGTYPVAHSN